jgi:uracil-DNA glycosylase
MEAAAPWEETQRKIWDCEACRANPRVAVKIRQQTILPKVSVSLLLVGLAPPHEDGVSVRKVARSATNDPSDNLRLFVEETLARRWDDLMDKGLFLIHAAKCAIVPNLHGSQNPPTRVVDCCNRVGFAPEFQSLRAPRVVTLGDMARRAVLKSPGVIVPRQVTLRTKLGVLNHAWPQGIPCKLGDELFVLHPASFPRTPSTKIAAAAEIRKAAQLVGLDDEVD